MSRKYRATCDDQCTQFAQHPTGMKLFRGPTIEARLETRADTTGFDYLRLGLAVMVLVFHGYGLCYGHDYAVKLLSGPGRALFCLIVPMFFALSGFLVCGSLSRRGSLTTFAVYRFLRLSPAFIAVVCLTALVLGPCFSYLALTDYFAQRQLRAYFLNLIGLLQLRLPGTFAENPEPSVVNLSIWTLVYEWECYVIIFLLAVFRFVNYRVLLALLIGVGCLILQAKFLYYGNAAYAWGNTAPVHTLPLFFFAGGLGFLWKERIVLKGSLAVISAAASYALLSFPDTQCLAPSPVAYAALWVGLCSPRKIPVLMGGDFSYGLYLCAFPIQQAVVALSPGLRVWWFNVSVSLPLSFGYAAFSWYCIEQPVLRRRKSVARTMEVFVDRTVAALGFRGSAAHRFAAATCRRQKLTKAGGLTARHTDAS
jgi:peptidoglycan/LPS O-acetylase OafA/YrhL